MPGPDLIRTLLRQASASGGRSTALNPLAWLFALELSGLLVAATERAPGWVVVLLAALLSLTALAYLGAYAFLLVKDREALRSERFTLSRSDLNDTQLLLALAKRRRTEDVTAKARWAAAQAAQRAHPEPSKKTEPPTRLPGDDQT